MLTAADCRLVHEDMTKFSPVCWSIFAAGAFPYYRKLQHVGYLRHLLLRRSVTTGEILVHVITTTQEEHDLSALVQELLALPLDGKNRGNHAHFQ